MGISKRQFSNGIVDHVRTVHQESTKAHLEFSDFTTQYCLVITMKFSAGRVSSELASRYFGFWYRRLCVQALGPNNIQRPEKAALMPLTYAASDFDGTQSGRAFGWDLLNTERAHVHAFMVLRPESAEAFRNALANSDTWKPDFVKEAMVEPFDPQRGTEEGASSYVLKGWDKLPDLFSGKEDCWDIFPTVASKSTPTPHQLRNRKKMLRRLSRPPA